MTWQARVNRTLNRTIGYQLQRARPAAPVPGAERLGRIEAALLEQGKAVEELLAASAPKPQPAARPPAKEFPDDYDEDYRDIIRAVRPYTMTGNDKLHAVITATRYVHRFDVRGAIVECGVWRGGSMHAVARTLDRLGDHGRELYLYDTFEGMTEPTERDRRRDGLAAADLLAATRRGSKVWARASLEDVRQGFATVPYPGDRVHYVKGPIEQTVPETMPDEIAILRLDTDWYESTAHEFTHLYPRLVSGGVLMIDDYGHWQGSREATDEFIERTGERLLLIRTASGRVAVKP